jgi:acetate kinase
VLNAGSSSLKAQFLEVGGEVAFDVTIERIGEGGDAPADHAEAVATLLTRFDAGTPRPDAVGHRVVHGGATLTAPTLLDEGALAAIEAVVPLAPLHNPANLAGIRAAMDAFGEVPHVAVFDTAFHATMPPAAYRYAVPEAWHDEHGVRRYGFHGISHAYVSRRAAELLDRPVEELGMVTAHLGNGQSVCAVDGGVSVDTSMGMGPLAGLVMGTRSGDVDPTIVQYLVEQAGLGLSDVMHALNKRSGMLGLAGSNDLRDVEARAAAGDEHAELALDVMVHRLVGYVAAYAVRMGRLDALVFTAGIGEHSSLVRGRVCDRLGLLGVHLDAAANEDVHGAARIDVGDGPAVLVVPTDEESEIARQVVAVVG